MRQIAYLDERTNNLMGDKWLMMDIPAQAEGFCSGGFCGYMISSFVHSIEPEITQLIVKEIRSPLIEHLFREDNILEAKARSTRLKCTSTELFSCDEFVDCSIDPSDGNITHVIMREGYIWDQLVVTRLVSQIDYPHVDAICLKLAGAGVEMKPAVFVYHWEM